MLIAPLSKKPELFAALPPAEVQRKLNEELKVFRSDTGKVRQIHDTLATLKTDLADKVKKLREAELALEQHKAKIKKQIEDGEECLRETKERTEQDFHFEMFTENSMFTTEDLARSCACDVGVRPTDRFAIVNWPSGSTQITLVSPAVGHSAAVGNVPFTYPQTGWKAEVRKVSGWIGIGVIANETPAAQSYGDSSSYMWACSGSVYGGGTNAPNLGGWAGWQNGDCAIFRMDTDAGVLKMFHGRLGQTFLMNGLPTNFKWRVSINMHSGGDRVVVSHATPEEMQRLQ